MQLINVIVHVLLSCRIDQRDGVKVNLVFSRQTNIKLDSLALRISIN